MDFACLRYITWKMRKWEKRDDNHNFKTRGGKIGYWGKFEFSS